MRERGWGDPIPKGQTLWYSTVYICILHFPSTVILHNFYDRPMLHTISLESSFMKSLSRTLIFGESLSYTVLRKVHAAH